MSKGDVHIPSLLQLRSWETKIPARDPSPAVLLVTDDLASSSVLLRSRMYPTCCFNKVSRQVGLLNLT